MKMNENDKGISKELMLRDSKTGQWIKRSDEELSLSDNFIPRTFIQVVNNEIHYADTAIIISAMLENRNKEKNEFLETKYNNIFDFLDNTRTYSSGFEKVFDECESNANEFDNEIRRISNIVNVNTIHELDSVALLNTANAYIKILFAYLYSALILHKEKVRHETVIYGKIKNLKSYIQGVLELALIPKDRWGYSDYRSSPYLMYIYDDNLDIDYIEVLVKYDRRFNSSLEAVRTVNNAALNITSDMQKSHFEFNGKFWKFNSEHPAMVFTDELIKLLGDIDRLENIREEIGNVDDVRILEEFDARVNK